MEVGSGITGARDVGAGQLLYATAKFIVDHSDVKGANCATVLGTT